MPEECVTYDDLLMRIRDRQHSILALLMAGTDPMASRGLGGSAERTAAGAASPSCRETPSAGCHVISGWERSVMGEQEFAWEEGDTFCVLFWYKYQHLASGKTVYQYHFDAMLDALGFLGEEGMDLESLVED
ncbi:gentisate 1-2-dioxygenase [Penicillium canariense]|uniref:Gentisate 1-2-dioxygenase n=1 Tax=Penicillium canariense TaxID=189055 RepID=A0A9W9LTT8_9EURO|nr:gentisate 1-2-dioxygenase [Penicillium canariense]KAJ5176346.1 gentisate 1-2-dioxygenase [Penicillium canariense]